MKLFLVRFLSALFAFVWVHAAWANDKGTADEAVALVKKAAAHIKKVGKEKAYADISDPKGQFVDKDLYVFVYADNGLLLAYGANPKLVGKNMLELRDSDGKEIIKAIISVAKRDGKGWVDYNWPNPVTKNMEPKSTYVERVDDVIVCVGIYK